jgi:hypothetical protein
MRKIIALLAFVMALGLAALSVTAATEYCSYPMPTPSLAPAISSTGLATNSTNNNVTNYWSLTKDPPALWHFNKTGDTVADSVGNCSLPAGLSTNLYGLWTNATETSPTHFWLFDKTNRLLVGVNRTCNMNTTTGNFSFNTSATQDIRGVWGNASGKAPTDFWLYDMQFTKIYHVNAAGAFAGTDFNCTLPSSVGAGLIVGLWSNSTNAAPKFMWLADTSYNRYFMINSTCGLVDTVASSADWSIVGKYFFGMKQAREFYYASTLSSGLRVAVNPILYKSNAALSVSYLRCANATDFEFTWKGTGYTNLTLDLPWSSGVLTGNKCEYGATFAERITSQNTSLGCTVAINSTKLYQGDAMKVYASVALQTTLPPNLPAAIGATAILGIIVIYKIVTRKKSAGFK